MARPAWPVVPPPARCLWVPGGRAGVRRSWKMGCSSSKLCLYSQCAAARVISICFAALFRWQGAGRGQGDSALGVGSPDLVTSLLRPWVWGVPVTKLWSNSSAVAVPPLLPGVWVRGQRGLAGHLPSPSWGTATRQSWEMGASACFEQTCYDSLSVRNIISLKIKNRKQWGGWYSTLNGAVPFLHGRLSI